MNEKIRVLLPEEEISRRVKELGRQITEEYEGEEILLVCTLRGACFFACDLAKEIRVPVLIDFLKASSYGAGTTSSRNVRIDLDVTIPVEGKNVIVVDDIIDTGWTLNAISEMFRDRGAKSVRLCTLLTKPDRREIELSMAYVGFSVPDVFVVGYGLDFDQKYRNLPYIGVLESTK